MWAKSRLLRVVTATAAATVVVASLSACTSNGGSEQKSADGDGKPLVLTTFTVLDDMAENVAGDHLKVESITKPGAEIHDYEPTPSDIKEASKADLILNNGLGLERWFEKFTSDSKAKRADLSEGVDPIDISEGEYSGKPNPHAWMSPKNGQIYVDNIVKAFSDLDPDNAADYRQNGENYKKQLQGVSDSLEQRLSSVPEGQRTLVSCEGAFSYLTRDSGLNEIYMWPVNAESEGTPQQKADVENKVKAANVPVVFCESTVNTSAMEQVAEATGARFETDPEHLLYVDSLSEKDGPVPTYVDLLKHDADTIADGLTGASVQ
ncbi:metal ABC transporter substrate-binding protein [Pseudoclavibacter sp. CFCC 13796]|uniref:metal ABC transporter substrate-binding protein n=1 Tax=Pseudoclavibacter sp. CFCC 13796 TaxID=2615179 RepID=UPI0013015987|nr:metal ABC transporter substrate-binding protein [Pseudoclavibacter sp. CFCC 13796]KAB1661170.1 metal ABC transporter substrate-binding protein [Pseudoclavibacter sp. CFCC 13796]